MNETDASVLVADILLEVGAVSLNPERPFVYSSGMVSPIYCDNRLLISYPSERRTITRLFCERIVADVDEESVDIIAATAVAGIPFGAWIAEHFGKPMVYVRPEEKPHGKMQKIEGIIRDGQEAVVIEDLITTAKSAISTAKALRTSDVLVEHCFSVFTYELLEASWRLQSANLHLHPLCGFGTLVRRALALGRIKNREYNLLLEWKDSQDATFSGTVVS